MLDKIKISNPVLLPGTIKRDIYMMLEYEDVDSEIIMEMIQKRCKAEITFSLKDLKKYLRVLKKNAEKLPIPISSTEILVPASKTSLDRNLDASPLADHKNKTAVLDMVREQMVERFSVLIKVAKDNTNKNAVDGNLETLILQYSKIFYDTMEKELNLRSSMQETNKYDDYMKEKIDIILMVIKGALKKRLSDRKYKDVSKEIQEVLKLYKF